MQLVKRSVFSLIIVIAFAGHLHSQAGLVPPAQNWVLRFYGTQICFAPADSVLSLSSNFTIELWVYPEILTADAMIVGRGRDPMMQDPFVNYMIKLDANGRPEFVQSSGLPGSYRHATSQELLPLHQWTHLAATLANGTMTLFTNGVLSATETSNGPSCASNVPFSVGAAATVGHTISRGSYSGLLRQMRVWNRALSANEVKNYASQNLVGNEDGLIACWPLDDGTGRVARDVGSHKLDLTLGISAASKIFDPIWQSASAPDDSNCAFFNISKLVNPAVNQNVNEIIAVKNNATGMNDVLVTQVAAPLGLNLSSIGYLKNSGGGVFADATSSVLGNVQMHLPRNFQVGDFNGDGRLDILIGDTGYDGPPQPGAPSALLIQTADGKFVDETSTRLGIENAYTHTVAAADINGDGSLDIYFGNCCGSKYPPELLINNGSGIFTRTMSGLPPEVITSGFVASLFVDVNNDGHPDLILAPDSPGLPDLLLINDGKGNFGPAPEGSIPPRTGGPNYTTSFFVAADFDNDGYQDLIISQFDFDPNAGGPILQLLLNNHNGTFRDASANITINYPYIFGSQGGIGFSRIIACDLNSDGLMDLVMRTGGASSPSVAMLNVGGGHFVDVTGYLPVSTVPTYLPLGYAIAPANFSGANKTDILITCESSEIGSFLLRNKTPLTFGNIAQISIQSFSPTTGFAGTVVRIIGTNFTGTSEVQIGGARAKFVLVADNEIDATVTSSARTGPIMVVGVTGTAKTPTEFVVPMSLSSIKPLSGSVTSSVTVRGYGFSGATSVRFGSTDAPFNTVGDTLINAMVPRWAQTGLISITGSYGTMTSSDTFLVLSPPSQSWGLGFSTDRNTIALAPSPDKAPLLNLGSAFTVEAWVYLTKPRAYGAFFAGKEHYADAANSTGYTLQLSNGYAMTDVSGTDGGFYARALDPLSIRQWHHLAGTYDGTRVRLYIDGLFTSDRPITVTPGVPGLTFSLGNDIGSDGSVRGDSFDGYMKEARVWSVAHNQAEIIRYASARLTGNEEGLAGYWPLDDGAGQTAKDIGPNKYNLTLGATSGTDPNDPGWYSFAAMPNPLVIMQAGTNPLYFGGVGLGSHKDTVVLLSNKGTDTLKINSISVVGLAFITRSVSVTVPPGQSSADTIRFAPISLGLVNSGLVISSNAPTSPDTIRLSGTGIVASAVEKARDGIPTVFSLRQNFPNPFNPSTTIRYDIPARSQVKLTITNLLGQVVEEIVDGEIDAGYHQVVWKSDGASGLYLCRLEAVSLANPGTRFVSVKKMILLR